MAQTSERFPWSKAFRLAVSLGIVWGGAMLLTGIVASYTTWYAHAMVDVFASIYPGFGTSWGGALLGLLLAFVRALFAYRISEFEGGDTHWLAVHYFPLLRVLLWLAIAVVVGVILAVVAAIYPAYRAARMEPVEAMRVDE